MSEQTTNAATPQTTRFDQVISEEADALVQSLVAKHPELRGAAVIFDWDLPKSAIGPLPAGAWRTKDGYVTPDKCYGMQHQLARFMNHMSRTILRMMEEVSEQYREMEAATQGARDGAAMQAPPELGVKPTAAISPAPAPTPAPEPAPAPVVETAQVPTPTPPAVAPPAPPVTVPAPPAPPVQATPAAPPPAPPTVG